MMIQKMTCRSLHKGVGMPRRSCAQHSGGMPGYVEWWFATITVASSLRAIPSTMKEDLGVCQRLQICQHSMLRGVMRRLMQSR
jgi:hypothetical protein